MSEAEHKTILIHILLLLIKKYHSCYSCRITIALTVRTVMALLPGLQFFFSLPFERGLLLKRNFFLLSAPINLLMSNCYVAQSSTNATTLTLTHTPSLPCLCRDLQWNSTN
jgi:hypothetical protein